MTPTLLQAVLRLTDVRTPDAELLARFVRARDEAAFEEIVRRHGALVWSVCRQLLPHHADAEDAFQAVFLALVQGAGKVRAGQALPAWLHGVAVRVATKARRTMGRRRRRETRAAVAEADRPVPDAAWAAMMAAVHEELRRLPEAERTAFILCELEGVRQPDAAARLGCPLGTLSGRLCKARQRLLDRLAHRGVVPGVLGVGGLAVTAGVAPADLVAKVITFPAAVADGISPTVAALARGLVEGATMRTKILAAAILVASAMGFTGGSMILSDADAQQPGGPGPGGGPVGPGGPGPQHNYGPGSPGGPGPQNPFGPGGPGMPGMSPGPGGMAPGGGGMAGAIQIGGGPVTWEYKFVALKIDDRIVFEKQIVQSGTEGWEFCGSERLLDREGTTGTPQPGDYKRLVLVFKKRKGAEGHAMGGGFTGVAGGMPAGGMPGGGSGAGSFGGDMRPGGPGPGGSGSMGMPGGPGMRPGMPGMGSVRGNFQGSGSAPGGMSGTSSAGNRPAGGPPPMSGGENTLQDIRFIKIKHAKAAELAKVLQDVVGKGQITADPRTNQLIVQVDDKTRELIHVLLEHLDVPVPPTEGPPPPGLRP